MKRGIRSAAAAAAAIMIVCLTGCRTPQSPITIAINDDIVSLDPAGSKDVLSESMARCIFSTLYTFGEDMELTPCLAESNEKVSESEWLFHLVKDAKFHDGTPITASDVKFSVERALAHSRADNSLFVIDQVEAEDDCTVRVFTKQPIANLPELFARTSTAVMSEKAMQKLDYDLNKPVGSGPFKLLERIEGKEIRLKKFDQYFQKSSDNELINFIIEPSEQNSTAALLNGKVDVLFRVSANDARYLKLNEDVKVYQTDSTKMEMLFLNSTKEPCNEIKVRQAIAYAINKKNIVDNVLDGYGKPASSIIPMNISGYAEFQGYSYDPEKAAALLQEAGYEDGLEITVLSYDEQRKKLMEYLKLDLAGVNITLKYECLPLSDYLDEVKLKKQEGSIMSWTSNPDPNSMLSQLYSAEGSPTVNQSGFSDERVEELIRQGRTEADEEKREQIYQEANHIIAESYYAIPLYQPSVLAAARKDIEGIRINPQGMFGLESLSRVNEK